MKFLIHSFVLAQTHIGENSVSWVYRILRSPVSQEKIDESAIYLDGIGSRNIKDGVYFFSWVLSKELSTNQISCFLNQLYLKTNWVNLYDILNIKIAWRKIKSDLKIFSLVWSKMISANQNTELLKINIIFFIQLYIQYRKIVASISSFQIFSRILCIAIVI